MPPRCKYARPTFVSCCDSLERLFAFKIERPNYADGRSIERERGEQFYFMLARHRLYGPDG